MACDLTLGRKEPCKDVVGGIKNVYFVDFGDMTLTFDSTDTDVIESVGTSVASFKYEVKGNSSLETTITSSRENGTTFYEATLNVTLTYLDVATQEQIKLLAHGRPQVVVEDYNGNFFLIGKDHGCEVTGGTIVTGAAMGDLSGFTLVLTAQETAPPFFCATGPTDDSGTPIDPTP